jgi:transcription antitermination factor NusG
LAYTNALKADTYLDPSCNDDPDKCESEPGWHILWTRSNCEKMVYDSLAEKSYELFLPRTYQWIKGRLSNHLSNVSMFKGYFFLRHAMDKYSYLDVIKTRGLIDILGPRWDKLAIVPDHEIETIRKTVDAGIPTIPYPYLRKGDRVRITHGPLANVEGILVKSESATGLLVLSINLMRRSIATEVDCTQVVPV